jgi:hypothetical protein
MSLPAEKLPSAQQRGVTYGAGQQTDSSQSRHLILIDQMIAWQIANPGKPWTECSRALGLTATWCRMVASTDAFRARYAEVRDDVIKEIGLLGLKEKIAAAADIALDRLAEKLAVAESTGDLTDAAEMLLKAHYGDGGSRSQSSPVTVQVNTTILEARERIMSGHVVSLSPLPAEEVKP